MRACAAPGITRHSPARAAATPAAKRAGMDRLEELRQAVGRKTPSNQEAFALWAVVRGFSADEVKSALEALPKETNHKVNDKIAEMLYYRWAQLEPETAAAAALAVGEVNNRRFFVFHTVVAAWSQRDPEAAIRWGRESGNDMAKRSAIELAARQWMNDDPATALSRARAEFPEAASTVFSHLVAKFSATPESRRQLFSLLAGEQNGDASAGLFSRLAYDLGKPDPAKTEEIAGEMAAAGILEAQIRQFRDNARNFDRASDSVKAFLEQDGMDDPAAADEGRRAIYYGGWMAHQPERALQWAEARGETGLLASTVDSSAEKLLQTDWAPGRESWQTPWADSVRKQFAVWHRLDAPAADVWLTTMPADLRKLVSTTTATPQNDAR